MAMSTIKERTFNRINESCVRRLLIVQAAKKNKIKKPIKITGQILINDDWREIELNHKDFALYLKNGNKMKQNDNKIDLKNLSKIEDCGMYSEFYFESNISFKVKMNSHCIKYIAESSRMNVIECSISDVSCNIGIDGQQSVSTFITVCPPLLIYANKPFGSILKGRRYICYESFLADVRKYFAVKNAIYGIEILTYFSMECPKMNEITLQRSNLTKIILRDFASDHSYSSIYTHIYNAAASIFNSTKSIFCLLDDASLNILYWERCEKEYHDETNTHRYTKIINYGISLHPQWINGDAMILFQSSRQYGIHQEQCNRQHCSCDQWSNAKVTTPKPMTIKISMTKRIAKDEVVLLPPKSLKQFIVGDHQVLVKNLIKGKQCRYCNGKKKKLKKCRCRNGLYCNKKCQKKLWKLNKERDGVYCCRK